MFQLLTTVMAIGLAAIVAVAGAWQLRPGRAVQADVTSRVMSTYRALELGVGAYRVANGGAMPGAASWRADVQPYAPYAISDPPGLSWSYSTTGGAPFLCVSTAPGAPVTRDVRAGLAAAAAQVPDRAVLAASCGAAAASDTSDGNAALTFPLQSGA